MSTNKISPKGIDHVCLLVKDLNETKEYLQILFDFEIYQKPDSPDILMVENSCVHFFIKESKFPKEILKEQHLSLEIDNLDTIVSKLEDREIKYETGEFTKFKHKNYRWVEWNDTNGIRFECVKKLDK